jgi:hypothetical protein
VASPTSAPRICSKRNPSFLPLVAAKLVTAPLVTAELVAAELIRMSRFAYVCARA